MLESFHTLNFAPTFVDNENVLKFAEQITTRRHPCWVLAVSLSEEFFKENDVGEWLHVPWYKRRREKFNMLLWHNARINYVGKEFTRARKISLKLFENFSRAFES